MFNPEKRLKLVTLALALLVPLMGAGCGSGSGGKTTAASGGFIPSISVEEVKTLFPDTVGKGKPLIVDFNSRFCLACQKLKPKLEKITQSTPAISFRNIDVQKLTDEEKRMMKSLGVTTVPYVAFISGNGSIKKVVLEDTPQSELDEAATHIVKDSPES